ncbi:hypothetical protein BDP55DRAFT_719131 [Colletotrichum godetiae]|uniref:Uncharacterized protein n=1 Tax=Colletotrichum godetiae TaxID=1209918 RepID=A0AAJ0AGG9_9PEZI|nr:uncharacterized protein BDP55DRAFT_719131 [Colletotrichum godetiae]KAK1671251.1 hypothetical protein BDP55DRAFT_719131 [Colletotrichum godetiae]
MCQLNIIYWPKCCGRRERMLNSPCNDARNFPEGQCFSPAREELVTRDYPCHYCIVQASQAQMEEWEPDADKRRFLILEAPTIIEKIETEPRDKERRSYQRALNTGRAIAIMNQRKAEKAAAKAKPRTPTQEDSMEIDEAGSSAQGGKAAGN